MIKKKVYILFLIVVFLVIINSSSFAGTIENVNGFIMYKLSSGNYATDTWAWLDTNGDSIAECYRFDENGHIANNYVDAANGRVSNDKGQLVENGFVMIKYLSSGNISKGVGTPEVIGVKIATSNIINNVGSRVLENIPFETENNSNIIKTVKIREKVSPYVDMIEKGIIYAAANTKSKVAKSNSKNTLAGKNLEKYIVSKNNCKLDVEKAITYGNEIWTDVIELQGNDASIKFNINAFNWVYFEVAEANHIVDLEHNDNTVLEVYFDGKLYDTLDEFVEGNAQQFEEVELDNCKTMELKVKIANYNTSRKVYIRYSRGKKIKENAD